MSGTRIRFVVYDRADRLCGAWWATSEIEAIRAAIREGYDAWSAYPPSDRGF